MIEKKNTKTIKHWIEQGFSLIKSGYPCGHKGCLNHQTHPCEWCGRIGGKGEARIIKDLPIPIEYERQINEYYKNKDNRDRR